MAHQTGVIVFLLVFIYQLK